jgi:hypothetical protein
MAGSDQLPGHEGRSPNEAGFSNFFTHFLTHKPYIPKLIRRLYKPPKDVLMMDKVRFRDVQIINKNGAYKDFFRLAPLLLKPQQHIGLQSQI